VPHTHIETPRIGFVCAKTREAAIRAAHAALKEGNDA